MMRWTTRQQDGVGDACGGGWRLWIGDDRVVEFHDHRRRHGGGDGVGAEPQHGDGGVGDDEQCDVHGEAEHGADGDGDGDADGGRRAGGVAVESDVHGADLADGADGDGVGGG